MRDSIFIKVNDIKISKDFNLKEFECRCCQKVRINPVLVEAVQCLRYFLDKPIIITSGYRCEKRNKTVGGVKNSAHLEGNAIDMLIKEHDTEKVESYAMIIGFEEVIVNRQKGYIHLALYKGLV